MFGKVVSGVTMVVLALTCGLFFVLSCCSRHPASTVPADVVMSDQGVNIKGLPIPVPCSQKELVAVVGDPSRRVYNPRVNTTLVWDGRGLIVRFKSGTDLGYSMSVVYKTEKRDELPRGVFKDVVEIDGKKLSAKSSAADIQAAGFHAVAGAANRWQRSLGKLECEVETDPSSRQIATITLRAAGTP